MARMLSCLYNATPLVARERPCLLWCAAIPEAHEDGVGMARMLSCLYNATPLVALSLDSGGGKPDTQSLACVGMSPSELSFHSPSSSPPRLIAQYASLGSMTLLRSSASGEKVSLAFQMALSGCHSAVPTVIIEKMCRLWPLIHSMKPIIIMFCAGLVAVAHARWYFLGD